MAHAAQLRARSDALPDRSLVPIRVLSTPIEQGMAFLRTVHDTEACPHKHRLMRLCPQCVAHWLAAQE